MCKSRPRSGFTHEKPFVTISVMTKHTKTNQKPEPRRVARKTKRIIWIVLIPVVVAGLVVGGLYAWTSLTNSDNADAPSEMSEEEAREAADKMFAEIDSGEQEEAEALLSQASTPEERANAYIALANSWSRRDVEKALEYAQQAAVEHESVDAYMAIVNYAEVAGETEIATEASRRASELGAWANEVE